MDTDKLKESYIMRFLHTHTHHKIIIFLVIFSIIAVIGMVIASIAHHKAHKASTDEDIANSSITTDKIASKSITADKLADNVITAQHLKPTEILGVSGLESSNSLSLSSSNGKDITILSDANLHIDAEGSLEINTVGGAISIGNDNKTNGINIGTGSSSRNLIFGNLSGSTSMSFKTGTGGVSFQTSGTGPINLASSDEMVLSSSSDLSLNSALDINIGNADDTGAINIGTGNSSRDLVIGNYTDSTNVDIRGGTGGVNINGIGPVKITNMVETVDSIDGNRIILDSESSTLFFINNDSGATINITLPSTPEDGTKYEFFITSILTNDINIISAGDDPFIVKLYFSNSGSTAPGISLTFNSAHATIGDKCNFVFYNGNWYVVCLSDANGSVSVAP